MMHPHLNTAFKATREASRMIIRAMDRRASIKISEKSPNDFVTSVDQQAEAIIVETLHEAYPDHNFLTEEMGEIRHSDSDITWIIDPIDGTTNFIHDLPNFVISIAAVQNNRLEHALIYAPLFDDLYTATRGRGSQLNGNRIRVSQHTKMDGALLSLGLPRNEENIDLYCDSVKALRHQLAGIRRCGATALDLAYVASGKLDGIWATDQHQWDIAAGALLIREAGGIVIDGQGGDNYLESGTLIAGNNKLIKPLLQQFRQQ